MCTVLARDRTYTAKADLKTQKLIPVLTGTVFAPPFPLQRQSTEKRKGRGKWYIQDHR